MHEVRTASRREREPQAPPTLDGVGRFVHAHRASLARVARGEGLSPGESFDALWRSFLAVLAWSEIYGVVDDRQEAQRLLGAIVKSIARQGRRDLLGVMRTVELDVGRADPDPLFGLDALVEDAQDFVRLVGDARRLATMQRAVVALRILDGGREDDVRRLLGLRPAEAALLAYGARADLVASMKADGGLRC
jgi:hypothetical protein